MSYVHFANSTEAFFPNIPTPPTRHKKNRAFLTINMIVVFFFLHTPVISNASALDLPKDTDGWTIFTPSSDTRIMYVSNSGNDSTGQVYSSSSPEVGTDPFAPSGSVAAFATYAAAMANSRSGYPDWILFKRGETFYQPTIFGRNGRSTSEPFLYGSYGTSGLSPVLKFGTSIAIAIFKISPSTPATSQYIAFQGLQCYAHTRNPADPEYVDNNGDIGISILSYQPGNTVKNILIEGCSFLYFVSNNITAGIKHTGTHDIDLRRNVFAYSYVHPGDIHSMGLFASNVDRILLEENVFYHNGWLEGAETAANGHPTAENHNTYFASVDNATFKNNIFMFPSSYHNKFTGEHNSENIVADGNLYIDGEIGIGAGMNYFDNEYRFINPTLVNNVFERIGESKPTSRGLGWVFWIAGWDGGTIANNLEIDSTISLADNISLFINDQSRNVNIFNNVFFQAQGASKQVYLGYSGISSNVNVYNNYFETPGNSNMVYSAETIGEVVFDNNQYHSQTTPHFYVNSASKTFAEWQTLAESTATFSQKSFTDKTRSVETYMQSLGETATIHSFIDKCMKQNRYNWDKRFTTVQVNAWIKEGFSFNSPNTPTANRLNAPAYFKLETSL